MLREMLMILPLLSFPTWSNSQTIDFAMEVCSGFCISDVIVEICDGVCIPDATIEICDGFCIPDRQVCVSNANQLDKATLEVLRLIN